MCRDQREGPLKLEQKSLDPRPELRQSLVRCDLDRQREQDELAQTTVSCSKCRRRHVKAYNSPCRVANVAGTQEPIYGPSAIQSVAEQARTVPWTELQKEHLKWTAMDSTCVETQTFYFMTDGGHIGMAQVIYSNVA